jgi:hypothetical protein
MEVYLLEFIHYGGEHEGEDNSDVVRCPSDS